MTESILDLPLCLMGKQILTKFVASKMSRSLSLESVVPKLQPFN